MPKWAVASALLVCVWIVYLPGNMGCADSMWSVPTAISLIDDRNPDLDEHLPLLRSRNFVFTQVVRGHRYTIYPLGTSLMAIPGLIALRPIANAVQRHLPAAWRWLAQQQYERGCPPLDSEPVIALHSWSEHLIASAIVGASVVVMFYVALEEGTTGVAVLAALLFAFGTSAWSTASRSLWQHGPSMLLLSVALLLQLRGRSMFWVGALLAAAYVVRPTNIIPLVVFGGWTLLARPRALPAFAAGAALVLSLFVWSNVAIYGSWLPPYYRPGFYTRNYFIGDALVGNLISPARGLFVYSPIFLLAFAGIAMKTASRRLTLLDAAMVACLGLHWIALAVSNGNWWGGDSYGPRFFTDLLPYLIYLLLPVLAVLGSARGVRLAAAASAVAVLGTLSVAAHAQGALNRATADWNVFPVSVSLDPVRVWDWKHPQFLAGLTFTPAPPPAVDLDAIACTAPPAAPGAPVVVENHGSTVVLKWEPAAGPVAVYVMDVGNGPGLSDQPSREARDVFHPTVVAHKVPPGTYYVRVRGRNRCGDGPSSPEVAVTVR